MLKEGGTNREGGQIGKWERDRQGEGTGGERQKGGQIGRGFRQGGYRQERGTDTVGVCVLLPFMGPSLSVGLVVRGSSLFVGGGSSSSVRARGWWW
jgi:hypothetical protein